MDDLCSGVSILRPEFLLSHIIITKSHLKSLNFKVLACNFLSFVLKAGVLSISLTPNIPKNMYALWTTLLWNIDNGILNTFSIWDSLKPAGDVPTLTQTILKLNALNIMLCSVAYPRCIPQKLINLIAMLKIYLLEIHCKFWGIVSTRFVLSFFCILLLFLNLQCFKCVQCNFQIAMFIFGNCNVCKEFNAIFAMFSTRPIISETN